MCSRTATSLPDGLGNIFFFARDSFAAHTNNVVNYCVSHDENTVPYEVRTNPALNQPATKNAKGGWAFCHHGLLASQ